MGLVGGPNTTTPIPQVACLQYISNPYKPGTSRPEYPAIFNKTLTNLIVLNPKKNPLAQATVPYNNPASHLHITYYLTSIDFAQSLMPRQKVVIATLAETAFKE